MKEETFTTWNHNTYGGLIFNTDYSDRPGTRNMAKRIASDISFDSYCKFCADNRDKRENLKRTDN